MTRFYILDEGKSRGQRWHHLSNSLVSRISLGEGEREECSPRVLDLCPIEIIESRLCYCQRLSLFSSLTVVLLTYLRLRLE
jgi:hypothetical protein